MKIMIILFLFLFLFFLYARKFSNPYRLIFVFGKKGSGKTTLLTKYAIDHIKKKWTVFSTVQIPGTTFFDPSLIGKMTFPERSLILIDEVGMIWDNRDFKNFKSEVRDFFKWQRQYRLKIVLFSQTFDVDLKLRNLTDEMWLLSNFLNVFSVQRRILKKITIKETAEGTSTLSDSYAFDPFGFKIIFVPRYIPFFKSFNPPPLPVVPQHSIVFNDYQRKVLTTFGFFWQSLKNLWASRRDVFSSITHFFGRFFGGFSKKLQKNGSSAPVADGARLAPQGKIKFRKR